MKRSRLALPVFMLVVITIILAARANAQLSVPLNVQEALYPGAPTHGIDRHQESLTVGVPLADAAKISSINQLSLSGASVGQFRVLGRWPSGNIMWVLVDTQVDLAAGTQNSSVSLTSGGTGNFGGAALATDNGATITVNTGAATFTIRKANFNGFDQVVVAGKTIVQSGSAGLVVSGPVSPNTSCESDPCVTQYLSSNDAGSTAVIEENGPVRAVVKATGMHRDSGGHGYMRFTVRMHFYRNKEYAKVTVTLRNADEGASGSFNSAAKGYRSYELHLTPALAGTRQFAFGSDFGVSQGNFSGSENAYLYQAYSNHMENQYWNVATCPPGSKTAGCVVSYIRRDGARPPYTYEQDGYQVVHGGAVLASGDHTKYPQGWADVSDASGAGVEIGLYQLAAYWPKSLQIENGGAEVRVGIWPDQKLSASNPSAAIPYYQAWPQYSTHDIYVNFHAAPIASPATEFLKFQHYLIARAPIDYYNQAQVFFYPLLQPTEEDGYWNSLTSTYGFKWAGNSPAVQDRVPQAYRWYAWRAGGGANQSEVRWGYVEQFLTRGLTGRFLTASHFYRFQTEQAFPRSDVNSAGTGTFSWRTHAPQSDVNFLGFPENIVSANFAYANRGWLDQEHAHWYGMGDYYFLTGDENIKDQMLNGVADRFLNSASRANQGKLWNTRAVGGELMGLSRTYRFLSAVGQGSELPTIQAIVDVTFKQSLFPELCVSGFPTGCTPAMPSWGVSRTRGVASTGYDDGKDNNCDVGHGSVRCAKPWMTGILLQGMWEGASVRGPQWENNQTGASNPYQLALDLAYGMATWTSQEDFVMGTGYSNSSLKYDLALDYANAMAQPTPSTDYIEQFEFNYFILGKYAGQITAAQKQQFDLTYLHMAAGGTFNPSGIDDHDMYVSAAALDLMLHPAPTSLAPVPLNVVHNGPGSYTLSWTVPAQAQSFRIKQSNHTIVEWIGFNPKTNTFIGDPANTQPWFAATEVTTSQTSTCPPAPGEVGKIQSCTVNGLDPAKNWYFAMKSSGAGQIGGGDHTPPTVAVTSPFSGSIVSGTVALRANAADDVAVAGVQFMVDGADYGNQVTTPPYAAMWDTSTFADGLHTVSAEAWDTSGNHATSNAVRVAVFNNKKSLMASMTAPANGAKVFGSIPVSATASGNLAIAGVQFLLDGGNLGNEVTTPPYSISWNTKNATDGLHSLAARARDVGGNTATSSAIQVTVANGGGNKQLISLTAPVQGAAVTGKVSVQTKVDASVVAVLFQVDGQNVGTELNAPPFAVLWDSSKVSTGPHMISARARDGQGNYSTAYLPLTVAADSRACNVGWCVTFWIQGSGVAPLLPPLGSSAWNKLNFVPDEGRFFIYTSDNIYTFSNSWWSYGVLGAVATQNPWLKESTSGTLQAAPTTTTAPTKGYLKAPIGATDTTITLQAGQGATFHPDPNRGGVLIIDDEEIGYSKAGLSGDTFTGVTRAIRGSVASAHSTGALVNGGAPAPQSRINGVMTAVEDHLPDRHPFLTSAYNSVRHQLYQATGIVENNRKTDTWYYCLQQNSYCPAKDVRVWRWLHTTDVPPGKADSAMTYDSDDDVMILYGGQSTGSPTNDTWLLCYRPDPQISGNSVGCPAGRSYPDWVQVATVPSMGAGPRYTHTIVYDTFNHKAVLFGGNDGKGDPNSIWTYTPATKTWTNPNPSGDLPSGFRRPAMTYDSTRHVMVLYQGPLGMVVDGIPGGLYTYDVAANRWTRTGVSGGPIPTSQAQACHGRLSIAYDPVSDTFVATEQGSNYTLQVWEIKGTLIH